jgi:hypothetical protein
VKVISTRILATMGAPLRVAGSYTNARTAFAAISENGGDGTSGSASRTEPSLSTTTVSTTVASPWAPSGYTMGASRTSFGATTPASGVGGGGAGAGAGCARATLPVATSKATRVAETQVRTCTRWSARFGMTRS